MAERRFNNRPAEKPSTGFYRLIPQCLLGIGIMDNIIASGANNLSDAARWFFTVGSPTMIGGMLFGSASLLRAKELAEEGKMIGSLLRSLESSAEMALGVGSFGAALYSEGDLKKTVIGASAGALAGGAMGALANVRMRLLTRSRQQTAE